jgi:hypothetical protein
MTLRESSTTVDSSVLRIELVESSDGYLARFVGEIIAETTGALRSIEPMLINEARVIFDFCGVTSVDGAGLQAAVKLMDAVYTFGGRLRVGDDDGPFVQGEWTESAGGYVGHQSSAGRLGQLTVRS